MRRAIRTCQRHLNQRRADAILVVFIIPNLHDGDCDNSGRVRIGDGVAIPCLFDFGFVAGNRIFLYGILNFRAVLVLRQIVEAGCPVLALEQLNESCAAIAAVYNSSNGFWTQTVLVVFIIPCFCNSDVLRLIHMSVDEREGLAIACDGRCIARNSFLSQRIVNRLSVCIFRQVGEHDRPLIISIQFFGVAATIRTMCCNSDFVRTHAVIVSVILPSLCDKELSSSGHMCIGDGVVIFVLSNLIRIAGNECLRYSILDVLTVVLILRQILECCRPVLCCRYRF